jgi:lysophospholipase L1-like esterase
MESKALIQAIEDGYKRRIKHFEAETKTYDLVMIGDSMIAYMDTKKFFPHEFVMNQGIAGDTTEGCLKRLSFVHQVQPKNIVVSIGSNDLVLLNRKPDDIAKSINQVYQRLKASNPHSNVFVCNVTPINDTLESSNLTYIFNRKNTDIKQINTHLSKLFSNQTMIDVYTLLKDKNGYLDQQYTKDGIHLNEKGYFVYTKQYQRKIDKPLNAAFIFNEIANNL